MKMKYWELDKVTGGVVSGTKLNALTKIISTIYDVGYALGKTLRKIIDRNTCLN